MWWTVMVASSTSDAANRSRARPKAGLALLGTFDTDDRMACTRRLKEVRAIW
jgi:hypothetical protein